MVTQPLWRCANCGREFANRNQSHACATHDLDHHFRGKPPEIRALFDRIVQTISAVGPMRVLPEKTRIAFQVRMSFAQVTPRRRWIDGHVVLARRLEHPRFRLVQTISPRNHVHAFRISSESEVDAEFAAWVREAYAVGEQRHLGPTSRGAPGSGRAGPAYDRIAMKTSLLLSLILMIAAMQNQGSPPASAPGPLPSQVIDWNSLVPTPTKTGQRRNVFDAPTETLDRLHGHITTLNPGENTGLLHRHPQEELVIIKEGTVEVNIDGRKKVVGPGSIVYFAVNENENMTNVGSTPVTYTVLQWFTPKTPKD